MSNQIHQNDFKFVCHVLQKAKTDTEMLAALLVVGKLIADKQLSDDEKLKLINLISFDFLLKLLDDYYQHQCTETDIYCQDISFCIDIVIYFFPTIIENYKDCEIFIIKIGDILFSKCNSEKQHLGSGTIIDIVICFDYVNKKIEKSFFSEQQKKILIEIYSRMVDCYLTDNLQVQNKFLNILIKFSSCICESDFNIFMDNICKSFASDKTICKFKLCKLINSIIANKQISHLEKEANCWLTRIRSTLFEIFKNRLNESLRDDAIELVAQLTHSLNGLGWIKLESWDDDNSKFFLLLLRLVCIEVDLFMMDVCLNDKCDSTKIGNCFVILEHLILSFCENLDQKLTDENKLKISNDEIISSISTITQTLSKVIEFIKEMSLKKVLPLPEEDIFTCLVASIRLVCIYVIEETEALRNEIAEIVPFIFHLFNTHKDNPQFETIKLQIIAAISSLQEDEEVKKIIKLYKMDIKLN